MTETNQGFNVDLPLKRIGTPECREWAQSIFNRHQLVSYYLKSAYVRNSRKKGYVYANKQLYSINKKLIWRGFSCSVTLDAEAIRNLAESTAKHCNTLFTSKATYSDILDLINSFKAYCSSRGFEFPLNLTSNDDEKSSAEKAFAAINRVIDYRWWLRKIRLGFNQRIESVIRELNFVSAKTKNPYISKLLMSRHLGQKRLNAKIIESYECIREDGVVASLADCVASSVSNPVNRRNELMVRMRGFNEIASSLGLASVMLTLTCPSRFHSSLKSGARNKRFDLSTPADGMNWLNNTWQRIRSAWARQDIKSFGFRVVEPNHDGTPHFHIVLFLEKENVNPLYKTFRKVALLDSPDEPGAQKYRTDLLVLDPAKGSAVSYIAKYIAKNIDGFNVGDDFEGQCSGEEGAVRVQAWASLWRIRQFQQIGSVPVTVWRELRKKLETANINNEIISEIRDAADRSDWSRFVTLMGGATCRRKDLIIRPFELESPKKNYYGERVKKLIGVYLTQAKTIAASVFVTRNHSWRIEHKVKPFQDNAYAASPNPALYFFDDRRSRSSWTCDNNCTNASMRQLN